MALVSTSSEWGNDTQRWRWARKWEDESQTVQNDLRLQIKVRDPIIELGLLGALNISFTPWSTWRDVDSIPVVDIVG